MAESTRKRQGELIAKLFEILIQYPEGLSAREAVERLASRVTMTPYEAGIYESCGTRRFEKIIRFATVDCVKAGWLTKDKGVWSVTQAGLDAYKSSTDPETFYRQAVKLYQAWKADTQQTPAKPSVEDNQAEENSVEKAISVTFEQAQEQAWSEIEQHILTMSPYEFQDLVADLLTAMGYHVSWISPPGKDGGIDIIAHTDPLGVHVPKIKVQVKRVKQKIDKDGLKSFLAIINDDDVGLYVSTGSFTRDAEEFARFQERRKITLIGLNRLVDMWIQFYPKLNDEAQRRLPLTPIYFLTP